MNVLRLWLTDSVWERVLHAFEESALFEQLLHSLAALHDAIQTIPLQHPESLLITAADWVLGEGNSSARHRHESGLAQALGLPLPLCQHPSPPLRAGRLSARSLGAVVSSLASYLGPCLTNTSGSNPNSEVNSHIDFHTLRLKVLLF